MTSSVSGIVATLGHLLRHDPLSRMLLHPIYLQIVKQTDRETNISLTDEIIFTIIDVCIDIYVMMSSDLYGTCRHCLCGTLFHMRGRNYNPFGNIATVTWYKTLNWTQMANGSNVF